MLLLAHVHTGGGEEEKRREETKEGLGSRNSRL